MAKVTKADIVDALYTKTGMERRDVYKLVDLLLEEIKNSLISYNTVEFRGFGTFEIRIRKGRVRARNPKTGEILSVSPHGIAAFRAGKEIKQKVWTIKSGAVEPPSKQAVESASKPAEKSTAVKTAEKKSPDSNTSRKQKVSSEKGS